MMIPVLSVATFGMAIMATTLWISMYFVSVHEMQSPAIVLSVWVISVFSVVFIIFWPWLWIQFNREPISAYGIDYFVHVIVFSVLLMIFESISMTLLFIFWIICILGIIMLHNLFPNTVESRELTNAVSTIPRTTGETRYDQKRINEMIQRTRVQDLKRKSFHFLAILMFCPGYALEPVFMHLSFSVALAALLLLEFARLSRLPVIGESIDRFMREFLDVVPRPGIQSRRLILDHVYLLLGCAIPVWLSQ